MEASDNKSHDTQLNINKTERDLTGGNRRKASRILEAHLRVFGLVYKNDRRRITLSKLYHGFVVILTWLNFLKYFAVYRLGESFGMELIIKLSLHILIFLSASSTLTGTLFSRYRPSLAKLWNRYNAMYDDRDTCYVETTREKCSKLALFLCWGLILGSFGLYVIGSVLNENVQDMVQYLTVPFIGLCEHKNHRAMVSLAAASLNAFMSISTFFQLANLCCTATDVASEFVIFNREFRAAICSENDHDEEPDNFNTTTTTTKRNPNDKSPPAPLIASEKTTASDVDTSLKTPDRDLDYWRVRHQDLCTIVEQLDRCFGLHVLLIFTTLIPILSFVLYSLVIMLGLHHDTDYFTGFFVMILGAIFLNVSIMSLVICTGTRLNSQATFCKRFLSHWNLKSHDWDVRKSLQLMTFYHRVQEGCIGLTGWNLFYIDKATAKMVVLMVVSYTSILLKFGEQNSGVSPFQCATMELEKIERENIIPHQ